ncbi:MAG: TetR/AcrR family transcriptional regulator [Candidatus Bathyarchaeota archaeon]|jgi:AcrR family transcriptional regulator
MTPRTTEDRWQETHNQILSSAEQLFATKGFNGTSMNDIVKDSGFSKGALYNHFESKERLFLSLWEHQTNVGIEQLKQLFSPEDKAVDKIIKVAKVTMASTCDCPREMGRIQIEFMITAARMKSLEPDMKKRYETIHKFIHEIFEEGVSNGEFKPGIDYNAITSILFAALDGLQLHFATLNIKFDTKQLQDTLIKMIFEGILAK